MNKYSSRLIILLLTGGLGFGSVRYISNNQDINTKITIDTDQSKEVDSQNTNSKNNKYHIGDTEFWDKALEASCMNTYDSDLKWLCKHDREKIEVIAHWVEVGSETKYNIVYKAPDSNGERFYHSSMDKKLKEKGSSSGGESISQEAVAIKDCGEDKIYTYVNNQSERYDDTSTSIVTLKYELDDKNYEAKYIFDRRGNEILEKYTSTFIDEELAIKIISKDSGISKKIIEKAEDDDWLFEVQNGLDSENQLYNYQFTDNGYTYNYILDATNGEIKDKNIQKDIGEKGALDIAMKNLGITENSFLRRYGSYMMSFNFPDVKKETTNGIIYKITISEDDDISHYYEIDGIDGNIIKHTFTTLYIIDKKNGSEYNIHSKSDKSLKYTINLKEIGMDDIYEFRKYIYLNIKYEGEKLIDWTIIDKDSNNNLGQLSYNELDNLYNFESKHKIIYAGNFTGGDILLSNLEENVIYKYTVPKGSYCDPHIINDLGTYCIVYKKDLQSSNAIQYETIPATKYGYPWASPLRGYCSMGTDERELYISYKKSSVEELLNISKGKVLNLSSFNKGDKIDREHGRTSSIDYLYNDTNDDITLFISNGHSDIEGFKDMTVILPSKELLFCSYSVSDVTLIKKGSGEETKMTKKEAAALALTDRGINPSSDNYTATVQLFKDDENNKEFYQVIIKLTDKNNKEQLYISYIDIETRSVIITEKKLFEIISKEPGLSLKKVNEGIKKYGIEKTNTNNFVCSIESDGLIYDYTINLKKGIITSRNIKNSKGENVYYGPDDLLYPVEEIEVKGNLNLSDMKENIIYKFHMKAEDNGRLYNRLGYPVILHTKSIEDNENNKNYSTSILVNNVGRGIGGSATHDEETYILYEMPSTEKLIETIGEKKITYISKQKKGERFDIDYFGGYLHNDTNSTQKIIITDKTYSLSDNKEHLDDKIVYIKPGGFYENYSGIHAIIVPDFSEENIIYLSNYEKGEEFEVKPNTEVIINDTSEALAVIIDHPKKDPSELNGELIFIKAREKYDASNVISFLIVKFG